MRHDDETLVSCPACFGRGFHQLVPEETPLRCSRCDGFGIVTQAESDAYTAEARAFVARALSKLEEREEKE